MTRSELREHAFKMLFQIEFNDSADMPDHVKNYFETLEDAREQDKDYIQRKYEAVASCVEEIDGLLNDTAKGWKTSRMSKVDLTILRLAVYEMMCLRASPSTKRLSWQKDSAVTAVPLL